jgi:hypothetical protein
MRHCSSFVRISLGNWNPCYCGITILVVYQNLPTISYYEGCKLKIGVLLPTLDVYNK